MSTHRLLVNFQTLPVLPQVLYVTHSRYEKDWASIMHSHAFTELMYIESGKGEICTQGADYPVESRDFIVIPPNMMHTERSSAAENLEYYVMGVSNFLFETYEEDPDSFCPIMDLGNQNEKIRGLLVELYQELKQEKSGYELMAGSIYLQLAVLLKRRMKVDFTFSEGGNMRREIANVKNYIDKHYMENLNLDDIASQSNLSKYHMIREFGKYIGDSPISYLESRRIEEAKILLSSTNMRISDIASEIGFSSASYFTQRFRELTGATPLTFRKESLRNTEATMTVAPDD